MDGLKYTTRAKPVQGWSRPALCRRLQSAAGLCILAVMMREQTQPKKPVWSTKNLIRLAATIVVVGAALFFLAEILAGNWQKLKSYQWQFSLPWLVLSYGALVCSYLLDIAVWRQTVVRMGAWISYPRSLRLWFTAGLAKYIPGTVWQFLGWFYLAQREGVSPAAAGTSIIITQALSALAGVLMAIAAFAASGSQNMVAQLLPLLLIIPLGLVALQPRLVSKVLNIGLTRIGRQPISLDLSFRDLATIFVLYLLSYVLWGLALFLFTNSLTPVGWSHFTAFLGVFPAAYALGLIAPFAPAGIGVREGVMTYLLSFFVPLPVATVIALLARPWMMSVELAGAGLALLSYARQGIKGSAPDGEKR
jgi:glycosyltransferase 2 family protein